MLSRTCEASQTNDAYYVMLSRPCEASQTNTNSDLTLHIRLTFQFHFIFASIPTEISARAKVKSPQKAPL